VRDELEKNFETLIEKNIISSETSTRILNELTNTAVVTDERAKVQESPVSEIQNNLNSIESKINDSLGSL